MGAADTPTGTPAACKVRMASVRCWGEGSAGFENVLEFGIEAGDGEIDADGGVAGEFGEEIHVPCDEMVLGDERHGVAEFGKDLQTLAGELKLFLNGLVAVGDATAGERRRLVPTLEESLAQKTRRLWLDHDAGFEIKTRTEAKVFVIGPGVAVGAAVLTATVGIDGTGETEIRAVVAADDGLGVVDEELGADLGRGLTFLIGDVQFSETLVGVLHGATTTRTRQCLSLGQEMRIEICVGWGFRIRCVHKNIFPCFRGDGKGPWRSQTHK